MSRQVRGGAAVLERDDVNHALSTFTCGAHPEDKHHRVRLKGVLVEQNSEVRVASARSELIGT